MGIEPVCSLSSAVAVGPGWPCYFDWLCAVIASITVPWWAFERPAAGGDRPGQRLLLDTMIGYALTVARAAGRLATPVPVLR